MNQSSAPPAYYRWPFEPTQRTADDSARWWAECHRYGRINVRLTDVQGWTIVTGETGSGKSIALESWRRDQAQSSLLIDYPPAHWPGNETLMTGGAL